MVWHEDIDCVAFTGSTATGTRLMEYAGRSNLKKVYAECGGKSPNIIFEDCGDLDAVAAASANAIFFNQGEVCVAASRLLLHESLKDAFIEKLIAQCKNMQPGNPLDINCYMGALVDEAHMKQVLKYIEGAKAEGANCIAGGYQVLEKTGGCYVEPTIFSDVTRDMTIFNEEIFGPCFGDHNFFY